MLREKLEEILELENPEALFADGFDDAIIGISRRFGSLPLVAYNYEKCINVLMLSGMTHEAAIEYFDFNVIGSWVGSGTPIFIDAY